MRPPILSCALLVAVSAAASGLQATGKAPKAAKPSPFWQSTAPFAMTVTVNLEKVSEKCLGARTISFGTCEHTLDTAPWVSATVTYADSGATVTLPARVRARGVNRLRTCDLVPPLWVDFKSADTKTRVFSHLNRFKLVMPCKAAPEYERYAIEEYNLYRLFGLMTPVSHLARMIRLTVVDSASGRVQFTSYAFAVEDTKEMAARLGGERITKKVADLEPHQTALVGLLQYMIGNTDFSIDALHNVDLMRVNGAVYPVANDFDQSGVIAAPYAKPDPKLGIKSTTERLYRGVCVAPDTIARVLAELRDKRPAIAALYSDDIGKLISGNGASESIKWFDTFYTSMSNPQVVKSEILDKCRGTR